MNSVKIRNKIKCLLDDISTLKIIEFFEKNSKDTPYKCYRHAYIDIEENIIQSERKLFCWLRAVYQHTLTEYGGRKYFHKVAIIPVYPKSKTDKVDREDWLAYMNAHIEDQIGNDVELVFKNK